ncbi:MAG: radical SAM protein [Candidatus Lernaella stagnicola]|nr:radical SAM protein [Candidatus Lernaella stagnicola]
MKSTSYEKTKTLLVHVHNRRRIRFNLSGLFPMLPLGIAMLGAALERAGHPVELLDLSLNENQGLDVGAKVRDGGFGVVGLSATVFSLPETAELAASIRRAAPQVVIVVGGPATVFPPQTLFEYMPQIDVAVLGEGEQALVELLEAGPDPDGRRHIPGVAYRHDNEWIVNPPAPPQPMDELPLPARHLLRRDRYHIHPPFGRFAPVTLVESARGCPNHCAFCSLPRIWRARGVEHVMEEVDQVIREDGAKEIHFVDPTFTVDPDRALELARALAHRGLHFTFKTRIDAVTVDLLREMQQCGCYLISYGVESLSDSALDRFSKGHQGNLSLEVLRQTDQAGIDSLAYMLFGNPGETFGDVVRTVGQLVRSGSEFALFSGLFPDPASELTHKAIAAGSLTAKNVADYYFRRGPLPDSPFPDTPSSRIVWRRVLVAFILFYFSPRTLWRLARRATTYGYFGGFLKAGWKLVGDFFRADDVT